MFVDIVVGLQHGDEGKGKVVNHYLKKGNYDYCIKYNGGPNAGHTIILEDGTKVVTHQIPAGVFHGVTSIIGCGCVIDLNKLTLEIWDLEQIGIDVRSLLRIDKNAHSIFHHHIEVDKANNKVGTTGSGIGPAYSEKCLRKGQRIGDNEFANNSALFSDLLIDTYDELYKSETCGLKILMEGSQGFELDIDHGDYPYVTSSSCISASALKSGISALDVRDIIGCAKAYDTYVGSKDFEPMLVESETEVGPYPIFEDIRKAGNEVGSTTGRARQVNILNLDKLAKSININGCTEVIINKVDILEEINAWPLFMNGVSRGFSTREQFEYAIQTYLTEHTDLFTDVIFSGDPKEV